MNKLKKIHVFGIGLLIVLIVVSASMFTKLYNEKCYWQERVANDNYLNWDQIYFMTTQVEKMGFTKEAIEEMYLYISGIVKTTETDLRPIFSGPITYHFLGSYYVGLAMDIAGSHLDDENLQLAIELFEDATIDLKELSWAILEMAEDLDVRVQLLDTDSDLYKRAEEMVLEYSEEYDERFSSFFAGLKS